MHWQGPFTVKRKVSNNNYEVVLNSNSGKTDIVNVNIMKLYQPWTDGQPSAIPEVDLTVHTRNLRRQYSKTSRNVKPGTLVIIPVEGDEHGPPSFEVAKVLNVKGKIKDSGHHELLVQYYGNNSGKVLGAYRPGWIFNDRRSKSTKHYFQKNPSRKTHEPYTSLDRESPRAWCTFLDSS